MKIQRLNEKNREQIEALCKKRAEYNFFIISSLDYLSIEQELVNYVGEFNEAGNLVGILMRYNALWYICDTPETDLKAFAEVIRAQNQKTIVLNDNLLNNKSLVTYLNDYRINLDLSGDLLVLNTKQFKYKGNQGVRKATLSDINMLTDFYEKSPQDVKRGADSIKRSMEQGRRTFILEKDEKIAACVLTTAEIKDRAMVGGVHVLAHKQSSEHLELVLSGIIDSLLKEDKTPYIVVRDSTIYSVCNTLGFDDVGPWRMVHMELNQ